MPNIYNFERTLERYRERLFGEASILPQEDREDLLKFYRQLVPEGSYQCFRGAWTREAHCPERGCNYTGRVKTQPPESYRRT